MNYHYYLFFVLIYYHLADRLCNCLQSHGLSFNVHPNTDNQSSNNRYCQRFMTHTQIVALLSKNTCPSLAKTNDISNNHDRTRRDINSGNLDIKALQTTINDHRTMIEYLFNNSINETLLAKALYNHSRTAPSFNSWRDWVDIFCISFVSIILLYLLICRKGFPASDRLLACLFRPVLNRLQQKKQQPQQQQQQQPQQQQQQQPQKQQQQQQQQETTTIPTAPPSTISEHIKSLSMIADGTHQNNYRTKH